MVNGWDMQEIGAVTLKNRTVLLRRVSMDDQAGYARIAFNPEIWEFFVSRITNKADLNTFLEQATHDTRAGTRVVFSIIEQSTGRIAGSTAYGNLAPRDRRLEIGWSWIGMEYRGTGINRAAKELLLDYAFDALSCERVEFKTDILNVHARRALKAIGATEEGTLRSFNYMPCGRRRDAIYYSILKSEWPDVRTTYFNR